MAPVRAGSNELQRAFQRRMHPSSLAVTSSASAKQSDVSHVVILVVALVLSSVLPMSTAAAQAPSTAQPAPKAGPRAPEAKPNQGSLPAQVAGAVIGNVLGMGLSFLLIVPAIGCVTCDEGEGAGSDAFAYGALATGWILRPLFVGGFTSVFSGAKHGPGRTHAAMLGSLPGVALSSAVWLIPDRIEDASIGLVVLGNLLSMAGAVAGYRYSARRAALSNVSPISSSASFDGHAVRFSVRGKF